MAIGERIKKLRKAKNWSCRKLAQLSGVSQGYISDVENGNIVSPSGIAISKLAKAFGVSTDYLLGHTDDPTPLKASMVSEKSSFNYTPNIRISRDYPIPPKGYEDLSPEEREEVDRITREFEDFHIQRILERKHREKGEG